MILSILFFVSGGVILLLLLTKMFEVRYKKSFFLLRLISLGDARVRDLSHNGALWYSQARERAEFFLKKQLPLYSRHFWNKSQIFLKEQTSKYMTRMRNARLLKPKNEGISEFFKNMADMEKEAAAGLEDTPENLAADVEDSQNQENKLG